MNCAGNVKCFLSAMDLVLRNGSKLPGKIKP